MCQTKRFRAFAIAATLASLITAPALAGSATVGNATGRDNSLGGLNSMVDGLTSLSQFYLDRSGGQLTGIQLNYNPDDDVANVTGKQGFTVADADWARANLRIYDIYRQLGGNAINLAQQYRRIGSQFYVGLDGSGGRWFASLANAQGYMFKLLVAASSEVPKPVKTALSGFASDDLTTVVNQARDAMLEGRGILARGTSSSLTLDGSGFSNTGGTPFLMGPDGMTFETVTFVSSEQITATVRTAPATATGLAKIFVYNLGDSMLPVDSFDVLVVNGTGSLVADADDHANTLAGATGVTTLSTTSGRIGSNADNDVFQVIIGSSGTLQVSSTGPTDVEVSIKNASGSTIATDSDSGDWYNFNLSQSLSAGTYYVRITHCCGGIGNYSLNASFTAD